ncbi:MAG: choice-of-anchor Q domain-containing protein [bacterium]
MKVRIEGLMRGILFVALLMGLVGSASAQKSLSYSTNSFLERWQNDGGIGSTITVTLTNDVFAGTNGQEYVGSGWVTPTNVPSGLTAQATRTATNKVVLSLAGNAASHTTAANISNLSFAFLDGAFSNGPASSVANASGTNLLVTFLAQVSSNWYVSATGSDANSGLSPATPFGTVSNAIAHAQTAANDVIHLAAGIYTENTGESFLNGITRVVTISGNNSSDTILQAASTPYTTNKNILAFSVNGMISNLALQNGNTTSPGGALNLANNCEYYFDSCLFASNATTSKGGAIYANNGAATLNFRNCQFVGNRASLDGGAVYTYTPGLWASNCTFFANASGGSGGALHRNDGSSTGSITVYNSLFSGNSATNSGGAIYGNTYTALTIWNSTLSSNSAGISGGALYSNLKNGTPSCLINNSTLYANRSGNIGGGIYHWSNGGNPLVLDNSTVFGNTAAINGGGVYTDAGASYSLYSSIVAGNTAPTGPDIGVQSGGAGTISRSLIGNSTNAGTGLVIGNPNASGSYIGTSGAPINPALLPLSNNGGLRLTCALSAASPAVNNGTNLLNLAFDERGPGFVRLVGTGSDMGAYEFGAGPARFIYSSGVFDEAPANDGSIDNSSPLQITLAEGIDAFTGVNGDNFVTQGKLVVSNLPSGLAVVASRASSTNLSVTITGKATANNTADSVTNLTFTFQPNALAGGVVSNAVNVTVNTLQLLFNDNVNPSLWYGGSTFTESAANNGAIGNTISITLSNDTFTGVNGDDFVVSNKVTVANMPPGLTVVLTRQGPKSLNASLFGSATAHNSANNVGNLTFTFLNSAFVGGNASIVSNAVVSTLAVQFLDPLLTYSAKTFYETWKNDGSLSNTLSVMLSGDSFNAVAGEDLVASGKVVPVNLPSGLTAVVRWQGVATLAISLLDNAVNHASYQNVSNLGFTFGNLAFVGNQAGIVGNYNESDLAITWLPQDSSNLYVSVSGVDTNTNNGSLAQPFRTVAYAVSRAQSAANDVIHLLPGVYTESNISVGKPLTFAGNTSRDTVLQAAAAPFTTFQSTGILNFTTPGIIRNLTLQNGYATNANVSGGAVNLSASDFLFDGCRFASNATMFVGGAVAGPENTSAQTYQFLNCQFIGNRAVREGGAIYTYTPSLWLSNCTFLVNTSGINGGAVSRSNVGIGTLTVLDSLFAGNAATTNGGAIYGAADTAVILLSSTLCSNSAGGYGGGLYSALQGNNTTNLVINSTLAVNTAGIFGGGVYHWSNTGKQLSLYNSTVFANVATSNGGGIYMDFGPAYNLYSSIVASNSAAIGPDIGVQLGGAGVVTNSLVGNNSGAGSGLNTNSVPNVSGSYIGTAAAPIDPRLQPLAINGGILPTCALSAGSPAINHGVNVLGLATDERGVGFSRMVDAGCDMGAFESGNVIPSAQHGMILIVN